MLRRSFFFSLFLCIFTVLPLVSSASAQNPLFGPKKYLRYSAGPTIYTDFFNSCNTGASYEIIVENGQAGDYMISSATITLNGVEIVRQNEFNQNVNRIEKPVTLSSSNKLDVKIASATDAFMNVSIYCTANCMDVNITSPADHAEVAGSSAVVKGVIYNSFGETGITLRNESGSFSLAQRSNADFAGTVNLVPGLNVITVTATDACGYSALNSITLSAGTAENPVKVIALPESGILAAGGVFEPLLRAEVNITKPVATYSWDFNGDGVLEAGGSGLSEIKGNYSATGIYFPRVTVIDTLGNSYSGEGVVNVLSKEEMQALLKGKWDSVRESIASGNLEKALGYFVEASKDRYRRTFAELGSRVNTIFSNVTEFRLYKLYGQAAEGGAIRTESMGNYSYPVTFVQDENGIWKIKGF